MIWKELASKDKPFFALAPMNDVTDTVFRQIIARCSAPDVFFSEFVSVDSLASVGRSAMEQKMLYTEKEHPLILQVWGINPDSYESQCRELATIGYAGIDINMGCPVYKIISKGACSALINDRALAKDIISASKSGAAGNSTEIPVSVKTRIGFEEIDLTWIEFLLEQNLPCLTVHCRTVAEQSKVPNHFEVLPEIVKMRNEISPDTTLIANGDITNRAQGEQIAENYGIDGLMIGRGVFSDPYVFHQQSPWSEIPTKEKLSLFLEHIELFQTTWHSSKNPDILKKFAKTYVVGFKGAHKTRENIMSLRSIEDLKKYIESLLDK